MASTAIWTALRKRQIPHSWATVLECLLWRCRVPGRDRSSISITELQSRTGVQRQAVVEATRYAHAQGWLQKINRRVRVWCEALRHHVSRQAVTLYVWNAPSEYTPDTVLSNYKDKEDTEARNEARKARGRGVIEMAARLRRWERQNPSILVMIGDAIRTVMEAPGQGLAKALASVPTRSVFTGSTSCSQSLIESVRRQRLTGGH